MIRLKTSQSVLFLLAISLLLAGVGCSSDNQQDVTYVVITGEAPTGAAAVNTIAPPTVTPVPPTPTPAPTLEPATALQAGDRYQLYGYYENAVSSYQSVLAQDNVPADIGAAAAFNMGRAAVQSGLFREAVGALDYLIANYPTDFRSTQAYFLRGDAYLGLSQWQNAINDFQQYLVLRPGLIDSYVYERIGDAQVNLGQLDLAFESYSKATGTSRTLIPQLVLLEKVARLHGLNGQVEAAIAEYDAILAVAQNDPYRASIEFTAGEALLDAGQTGLGLDRMRLVFSDYPDLGYAYDAMEILLENGVTLDDYQQGIVSYYAGDYQRAIDAFNRYTTSVPLSSIPAALHLFLGRAYRALGNSEAAQVAFQTLIQTYPQDPLFGEAVLETGRTLFLKGEIDAAIDRYTQIATTYAYLPEVAAEALWRVGYLYGTNDRPLESQQVFLQLSEAYPQSEQSRSGLFFAASAAMNAGDTFGAENLYNLLVQSTTGEDQAAAYLQVGRLARARGDETAATTAFNNVLQIAPDTYYSARANDLLARVEPFRSTGIVKTDFDDLAEVTEAENWLRTVFAVQQTGPLWPLSAELQNDPHILRGRELWVAGAFEAATDEFFSVIEDHKSDGLASYQLAVEMRLLGAFRPSIFAAANVLNAAGVSTLDAPAYIARMRYPIYYYESVVDVAQQRQFDPLLLFSLIRHESFFDTNASGAAGEKGLTQVIPPTGEYIAQQLNWPEYQHADLYRPYAGIAFGAYYLDEQLDRFDQNVYAALAGYNAGPGRAIDWLELSGGDPDRFMSAITIDSVQLYVQLIYRNFSIYRELYGQ